MTLHPLSLGLSRATALGAIGAALLAACSSNSGSPDGGSSGDDGSAPAPTCLLPGGPASVEAGGADMHCVGQPPQETSAGSCMYIPDGGFDSGPPVLAPDAGPPLPCGEDSASYGATMYGNEGDDDDCKYHIAYSVGGVCENESVYFVITATSTVDGTPVTGAATYVETCLNDMHIGPIAIDAPAPAGKQKVRENPPGTYTVGPIQFDAPGKWTVRFHFFETCYDTLDDSPHGHAAFFVDVP